MPKLSDAPRFKLCVICGSKYERGRKSSNEAWDRKETCNGACRKEYLRKLDPLRKSPRLCKQCRVTTLIWCHSNFCSQSCREIWDDENEYNSPPEIIQEWPGWMEIKRPFAVYNFDPGDGIVTRLNAPDPHRLGISIYGSSADWAMSYGSKAGPLERKG